MTYLAESLAKYYPRSFESKSSVFRPIARGCRQTQDKHRQAIHHDGLERVLISYSQAQRSLRQSTPAIVLSGCSPSIPVLAGNHLPHLKRNAVAVLTIGKAWQ